MTANSESSKACKLLTVFLLAALAVFSSVLQFHSHDCSGHMNMELCGKIIGCTHHHGLCMAHSSNGSNTIPVGHDSSTCAMHLNPGEMAVSKLQITPTPTEDLWQPCIAFAALPEFDNASIDSSAHFPLNGSDGGPTEGFIFDKSRERGSPMMS